MKRISLLSISVSLILCTSIQANDYSYVPLKNKIRWSPYQHGLVSSMVSYTPYSYKYGSTGLTCDFVDYSPYDLKYGSDGLVFDTLDYSSYALKYGGSGLVEHNSYYSPYAFDYNGSGLIYDTTDSICCYTYTPNETSAYGKSETSYIENKLSRTFAYYSQEISNVQAETRKEFVEKRKAEIEKKRQQKANDLSEVICQILKSKNVNFSTNRNLLIDGKTISINFDIPDANLIIKFWNTKEIQELVNDDINNKRIFDNYIKSWQNYCIDYIGNTKQIINIYASDKEDLYKQFSISDDSNNNDTIYALAAKQSPEINN